MRQERLRDCGLKSEGVLRAYFFLLTLHSTWSSGEFQSRDNISLDDRLHTDAASEVPSLIRYLAHEIRSAKKIKLFLMWRNVDFIDVRNITGTISVGLHSPVQSREIHQFVKLQKNLDVFVQKRFADKINQLDYWNNSFYRIHISDENSKV